MGRKYRTSIYKKANENMKRRKRDAMEIINKSRVVDKEMVILKLLIVVVVIMFISLPFIIIHKKKYGGGRSKIVDSREQNVGGTLTGGTLIDGTSSTSSTTPTSGAIPTSTGMNILPSVLETVNPLGSLPIVSSISNGKILPPPPPSPSSPSSSQHMTSI